MEPERKISSAFPLIRWAGSKRKILAELQRSVPGSFERYIEPFFGSGCLYFALQPERAIVADLNPALIHFYQTIASKPISVLRSAIRFKRTAAGYYKARLKFHSEENSIQRASLFLFLNRFSFNGIFRTNQKGQFNVPFGTRTGKFPTFKECHASAKLLRNATIVCSDFEQIARQSKRSDFVYLDPPYAYQRRRNRGEYGNDSFCVPDIKRLQKTVEFLDRRKTHFLLSYLDCEEISSVRQNFRCKSIPVARTVAGLAASRVVVNEILISNF